MDSGEIQRRQIKRAKLTEFFAKCQTSLVAMEACSSSHYWARTLMSLGLQVKILPAQHVKAFLLRDKTDAMDAQAIWVAAQPPHILPIGHNKLLKSIQGELAKAQQANLLVSVQEQLKRIDGMQDDIEHIGQRLLTMIREDRQMQAIQQIPCVGDLTASALVAAVGDLSSFKSGRQFASWVGLTPRQVGTGGKT